ncbi:MAG: hypothetical protein ACTSUE_05585 [Promethearchaeota archaeon]
MNSESSEYSVPPNTENFLSIYDPNAPPGRQQVQFINDYFKYHRGDTTRIPTAPDGTVWTDFNSFSEIPIELQVEWWILFISNTDCQHRN